MYVRLRWKAAMIRHRRIDVLARGASGRQRLDSSARPCPSREAPGGSRVVLARSPRRWRRWAYEAIVKVVEVHRGRRPKAAGRLAAAALHWRRLF
jgi:hypothetical protein